MKSSKVAALVPLTGVLSALLFAAGVSMAGSTPDSDSSGAKVITYFVKHKSDQQTAAFLFLYACLFLVFFAASLRSHLRSGERGADGLATLSFGGSLVMVVGILLIAGVNFAIADKPGALDPAAAQALNTLNNGVWFPFIVGQCAFQLGAGIAILRSGALPAWLGWVAIVLGVVSGTPVGWFAFLLGLLWLFVTAILLVRRISAANRAEQAAPDPAPAS